VNLAAGDQLDEFPGQTCAAARLDGNVGLLADEADDVANGRVGVESEQQVGRAEMEKLSAWDWMICPMCISSRSFFAVCGISRPTMASQALALASRWLTGQMPQVRG